MSASEFFTKPIGSLSEEDLRNLVEVRRIREHLTLDYKRDAYSHGREGTIEMLADISSMANASGGNIIIGVDEDRREDKPEGTPGEISGIENGESEASWIHDVCTSSIVDPIAGLQTVAIPLSSGRSCVVVRIPNSARKPHAIDYQKHHSFRIRSDRDKRFMNMQEVRDMFTNMTGYRAALSTFLEERHDALRKIAGDSPWYGYMATPIYVDNEKIDPISDPELVALLDNPPPTVDRRYEGLTGILRNNRYPQLFGIERSLPNDRGEGDQTEIVRLFRNGHFEYFRRMHKAANPALAPLQIDAEYIAVNLTHFLEISEQISLVGEINQPWAITVNWLNICGSLLKRGGGYFSIDGIPLIESDLTIEFIVPSLTEPNDVAHRIMDRLYNAFGFDRCTLYDQTGALKIR